jgi:hypothetical protein
MSKRIDAIVKPDLLIWANDTNLIRPIGHICDSCG